ncbi:MAG: flagellar biosynthetic protein FliR [Bryobacteraceae bacterium]
MLSLLIDERLAGILSMFLLTLARTAGVVAFTPVPGFRNMPSAARGAVAVLMTCALFDFGQPSTGPPVASLLPALLIETSIGICYGLATALLFEGIQLGAQIVGLQAGFSYASTLDPNSQADSNVLSVLMFLGTGALFFAADLHHVVFRALAEGLLRHPAGAAAWNAASVETILQLGADVFRVGLRLAAPVSAIMLTIDIGLALFGRMQPQLQVVTLSFSIKILIALIVFSSVIQSLGRLLHAVSEPWSLALRSIIR